MGQPNGKEGKYSKQRRADHATLDREAAPASVTAHSVGVRTSAVRENVLQQTPQYRDPMAESSLIGRSSGAVQKRNSATASAAAAAAAPAKKFPVVLRYADKDVKALLAKKQKLFVVVEALGWKPVPMAPSEDSFYALLELAPGLHRYRFLLDDKAVVDNTQPLEELVQEAGKDAPANLLQLNDVLLTTKEDEEVMDDGEGWGQEQIMFEESRKYPPIVPVHLRYTPLNTPPTGVRCTRDGVVSAAGDVVSPEHLPLPLNVTINHIYFQRREDHSVMGLTTRYCNKYTTVVYYSKMGTPSE
ncbi:5-AMP-activated protein kinase, regulatory beta subunit [Trypanosoma grayi]|uniref:5-AMP-activated protein kinase, regulatory beta subunit n=1 Tax=Trypanosoma grayi TaxID=71804 RepID=UPI0004F40E76|nr:5-AMP-activated protein kinase, regulatory beta subunit [Trypanosoma grayi]KEG09607.1 5-AMP-activated protein kinase, regulatory beta subunit [Trypanosoma grayi]